MIRGLSDAQFVSKLYGGWLGKAIGVKQGMYVENWSSENVLQAFGPVDGPIARYPKRFAADDDTNGPAFYPRAVELFPNEPEITPFMIAETVLNFCGDHHGFFWWGGDGTGYDKFRRGLRPPHTVTESGKDSLTGMIFTDGWGLLYPCAPEEAAEMARRQNATHTTGEAYYAGGFFCACIAEAYRQNDIEKVVETALNTLPSCRLREMVEGVLSIYREDPTPSRWQNAHRWMMDRFVTRQADEPYNVHANGACILIALLYGRESFDAVMNIGTMCAWDCDCNLANAGAIMGALVGAEGISPRWRDPQNDFLCLSSTVGSMNGVDLPGIVAWFAQKAYELAGETIDDPVVADWVLNDQRCYHFELPGSTHALMTEQPASGRPEYAIVTNTDAEAHTGNRSLLVVMPRATTHKPLRVFAITYPQLEDFSVFGYQPDFCPILYPGQSFSLYLKPRADMRENVTARAYVRLRDGQLLYGDPVSLTIGKWHRVAMTVPSLADATIIHAGVELIPSFDPAAHAVSPGWAQPVAFYLDDFAFSGSADYRVTFANEILEPQTWGPRHVPSQCSYTRGDWNLVEHTLVATHIDEDAAECYTGDVLWRDYRFEAEVQPMLGHSHGICARVRGGVKSVGLRLAANDQLELYVNTCGYRPLAAAPFQWKHGETYRLSLRVEGNAVIGSVDDELRLEAILDDPVLLRGCVGFVNGYRSLTRFHSYAVRPL